MSQVLSNAAVSIRSLAAIVAIVSGSTPEHGIAQQTMAPANELPFASPPALTTDTVVADPMTLKGELRDRLLSNRPGFSQEVTESKELPAVPNIALQAIVVSDDHRGHAFIKVAGSEQGILLQLTSKLHSEESPSEESRGLKSYSEVGPTLTIAGRTLTLSRWSRRCLVFQTQLGETIFAR